MSHILVVDDDDGVREFLSEALERDGQKVTQANCGTAAIGLLSRFAFDVIITDLKMPDLDGMEIVKKVRDEQPDVEVIVLTAHGSVESAVQAMRAGAFDYLQKPLSGPTDLRMLVARALERRALRARVEVIREEEVQLTWGAPAMAPVVDALRRVATTNANVLLLGESGTGKEVAALAIHRWSHRKESTFAAVNCAALAETLLDSELFGHEKGAFTGANTQHRGRIELAQGGTFFLDEIAELKPQLQAKLLRVLQERRFERVGGNRSIEADVRWIAATHRDLGTMIAEGNFREDVYHRLAVFPIRIPALRERREDIRPLAKLLLQNIAREFGRPTLELTEDALKQLELAPWPGNVRELRNVLERAAILTDGPRIEPSQLWIDPIAKPGRPVEIATALPDASLENLERLAIEQALQKSGGNRKLAAERLQIGLRTLYEKLRKYDIS